MELTRLQWAAVMFDQYQGDKSMHGNQQTSEATKGHTNDTAVAVFIRISIIVLLIICGTVVAKFAGYSLNRRADESHQKAHQDKGDTAIFWAL